MGVQRRGLSGSTTLSNTRDTRHRCGSWDKEGNHAHMLSPYKEKMHHHIPLKYNVMVEEQVLAAQNEVS